MTATVCPPGCAKKHGHIRTVEQATAAQPPPPRGPGSVSGCGYACSECTGDTNSALVNCPGVRSGVTLTDDERREIALTFHGVQWLSPERAECIEHILAARLPEANR